MPATRITLDQRSSGKSMRAGKRQACCIGRADEQAGARQTDVTYRDVSAVVVSTTNWRSRRLAMWFATSGTLANSVARLSAADSIGRSPSLLQSRRKAPPVESGGYTRESHRLIARLAIDIVETCGTSVARPA